MRIYNQPHRFYCGVDLHARSLFVKVLDGGHSAGVEPASLLDRSVGTERFLRRRSLTATVRFSNGAAGPTS